MATAADGQLRLDVETDFQQNDTGPAQGEPDLVGAVLLEAYHGDYRVAIAELLADADFLRDQLFTASSLMSSGMGRGWRPKYERLPK